MDNPIIQQYRLNAAEAHKQHAQYERLINTYSIIRLTVFFLLVAAIYWAVKQADLVIFGISFIILGLGFAWLVKRQSEFETLKLYYKAVKAVNENEIESILNHGNIYNNGAEFADDKHYYAADLDIFGNASLFQLLNRAATAEGNNKLAGWLTAPANKNRVIDRQNAVKELADKNDWKLDIQAHLLFSKDNNGSQLSQLFRYLHTPLNLTGEKWLAVCARIAPFLMFSLLALSFVFPIKSVVVIIGLINVGIAGSKNQFINKTNVAVEKTGAALSNYAKAFAAIEGETWQADLNIRLAVAVASSGGISTSAKINLLHKLIDKFNYRYNILVGFFLNAFFLWDIRQMIAIENWKRQYHDSIEQAFVVLFEFEALCSLASLHINYPEWCFPQISSDNGYIYQAENLAHPLIKPGIRVENDYSLNGFKIDIITGSNMAGKSTFLRTLGINAVLALSGAPVCAQSMEISVMQVVTYMRIKDSLNESTSTFKAELDRLQMLLKAVNDSDNIFFLIDEMLRGTNSADKYIGSKAVIEQLISEHGVGLVATHDLQLSQLEQQYPDYVRNFYFDIQVQDGEMIFDYKIKPGECKTFNASMLLKKIGIKITEK
ncbi:MutS-related protein [Mucilaginibacter sp. KACC 22063]|uniref:MutS-related protein n=1 Tax=Mucilaginibacter sp. KACC 22063 TaxID=3025666 RepID=UPI0023663C8D|nr:DNA mismatch repair protein MutS [Mucilaginibacter sp. KACC 22063]WDF54781.1 DNA mismatch repair protein MutS [Mucilaginibacter sp. KACC 22063]